MSHFDIIIVRNLINADAEVEVIIIWEQSTVLREWCVSSYANDFSFLRN